MNENMFIHDGVRHTKAFMMKMFYSELLLVNRKGFACVFEW